MLIDATIKKITAYLSDTVLADNSLIWIGNTFRWNCIFLYWPKIFFSEI